MGDVTTTKRKRSTSPDPDTDSSCWQLEIKSIADKWGHMFQNKLHTDTRLLVGQNLVPVDCHKIVLILNSPVFESMLSTRCLTATTGTNTELRLPRDDPCSIKLLVSCFYNGNPATVDEALDLLLVSKKYICPHVTKKCVQFLKPLTKNCKHVIQIFQTAYHAAEPELLTQAVSSILSKAFHLVRLPEFSSKFNFEHLKYFLSHDHLNVDEVDLFNAVYKWGQLACERRNLDPTKCENISMVLKDIFPLIRFSCMSLEDFSVYVASKNVLPLEQTVEVFKFLAAPPVKLNKEAEVSGRPANEADKEPPHQLQLQCANTKPRSRNVFSYIFKRLQHYDLSTEYDFGEKWNNFCFRTDQDIKLVSLGFYRSIRRGKQIVVSARILDEDMTQIFSERKATTTCSRHVDVFHVPFPKPVRISKEVFYTISYKIQGEKTFFQKMEPLQVQSSCTSVSDLEIGFSFKRAKENTDMNQVPELCFQL